MLKVAICVVLCATQARRNWNTRPVEYDNDTIDYTQAVDIAFPNIPKGPDVTFSVTFTGAKGENPSGSLVEGGASARVKKGMSVDVVHSNRS